MDVADLGMGDQVRAGGGVACDDPEVAALDERPQRPLPVWRQVVVDRIALEHRDAVLDEHRVQQVARRDRRHVPGAEHELAIAL